MLSDSISHMGELFAYFENTGLCSVRDYYYNNGAESDSAAQARTEWDNISYYVLNFLLHDRHVMAASDEQKKMETNWQSCFRRERSRSLSKGSKTKPNDDEI